MFFTRWLQIRLVTETFPELGRFNAKLTHNLDAYTLSTRIWSGPISLAVKSYGLHREKSSKGSITLTAVDPSSSWQNFVAHAEVDHLGKFPYNFEVRSIIPSFIWRGSFRNLIGREF